MPDLKDLLTAYVDSHAPMSLPPYERVVDRSRVRRMRRRRWAVGSAVAATAATASVLWPAGLLGWWGATPSGERHAGVVQFRQQASCVTTYSPQTLSQRTFAFDGTVSDVGQHPTGPYAYTPVRFRVNEWFLGGSAASVVLDMPLPAGGQSGLAENTPPLTVGTRLLVSGEPQTPGGSLEHALAWGCGFTRYYDEKAAAEWRTATATAQH